MSWYVRAPGLVAIARRSSYLFVIPERAEPVLLEPVDVEGMAAVLARAGTPIEHGELVAACDEGALAMLVELGVLRCGTRDELGVQQPGASPKRCKRIVVGLTGAVSVAGALDHVVALADTFAEHVDVVISRGAAQFIQPRLYDYYGFTTWTDAFEPAHGISVPHRHLATSADLVLIAPASANTLHRLATGACSDLLSLVVAVTAAPVVVAPSMNPRMWTHPPIQRNVAQLRADGVWVIDPHVGVPIAARETQGVGGLGFDSVGLLRALDAILPAR